MKAIFVNDSPGRSSAPKLPICDNLLRNFRAIQLRLERQHTILLRRAPSQKRNAGQPSCKVEVVFTWVLSSDVSGFRKDSGNIFEDERTDSLPCGLRFGVPAFLDLGRCLWGIKIVEEAVESQFAVVKGFQIGEFCRLLFGLLSRKLKRTVPLLLNTPAILAHTVYQTLIFDGSVKDGGFEIRRTWEGKQRLRIAEEERKKAKTTTSREARRMSKPPSYEAPIEWEGLSDIILGRKEWFDAWLDGEKRFADNQYNEIISSPDAWQISDDGDGADSGAQLSADYGSRATTSARRFKALIERVTERYQPLPHLVHKSHFLFEIQLPLLEAYLSRITSSLDAYERLSSSFVRAVPGALAGQVGHGVDMKRLTSGVEGLTRVVKALVSARWIKAAMETWGEDLTFLELWHGIQENPVLRARADANSMLPKAGSTATLNDQADTTMFDILTKQYGGVVSRAEDMVVKQICAEVEGELKPYFASQYDKTEADDTGELNALSIPATLVAPISLLSSEVSYLAQTLPTAEVTGLYRKIAASLATHIIQRSVSHRGKGQFSPSEGQAFKDECAASVETCRMALSRGGAALAKRADLPWQNLTDVAAIVGLPESSMERVVVVTFDKSHEEFEAIMQEIGIRALSRTDVQNFLQARTDFRR